MVIRKKNMAMLLGVSLVGACSSFAQANLVVNGSFENPGYTGDYQTAPPGGPSNWTVSPTVDYIGTYWDAEEGKNSLDMSGNNPGSVSQALTLVAGQEYLLEFWMSGNPDGPPLPTKYLDVSVGSTVFPTFTYTLDIGVNSEHNMRWEKRSAYFVATSNSEVLQFTSPPSPNTPYGAALDNVSVVPVPLPGAAGVGFSLLAGAGLFGGFRKRIRRSPRIAG